MASVKQRLECLQGWLTHMEANKKRNGKTQPKKPIKKL